MMVIVRGLRLMSCLEKLIFVSLLMMESVVGIDGLAEEVAFMFGLLVRSDVSVDSRGGSRCFVLI